VPTETVSAPLSGALAHLQTRWGSAAVRVGSGGPRVNGALALAPQPVDEPLTDGPELSRETVSTGFASLDALLGTGGLPRAVSASLRGARSSGKTTLALHCIAAAQAAGAIAAIIDIARVFDPLEAASRGVDLRWLLIVRPAEPEEGLAIAATLLSGRAVDLLLVDLPERLPLRHEGALRRLAAHARRTDARLIVLEPSSLDGPLHGALAEVVGVRLELEHRSWLRLGRDVVGRRVAVNVAKNRFGPPGRSTEIDLRYLDDGEHAPAVARSSAIADRAVA
jgi:recombination protein RecA